MRNVAYKAKKTEHSGSKRGNGAYRGPKKDAKRESAKTRRMNSKDQIRDEIQETQLQAETAIDFM
ncbi:MAG: hypothetical protein HY650_02005 [Acidobacteria bacterium]|nr:hypothetical protein [Acidobacteriota bacterium]